MRILLISCVFPPEPVVSAQTSATIAQAMVQRGHEVTVVSPYPNRPGGHLYPGYVRHIFTREKSPLGFTLIRCFATLSVEAKLLSRFLENFSFGFTGGCAALLAPRPDLIYANTWPIFATGLLALIAWLRKVPLVISVQDIYPESLIAQKRIDSDSPIARLMRWIDRMIVQSAQAVIVISERFATIYCKERHLDSQKVHIVSNWVDQNLFATEMQLEEPFRQKKGIPSQAFVGVYGGNVGAAAGVETVITAFQYLGEDNIYLVVAGEGSKLQACQQLASEIAPNQVLFHSPWPVSETATVLSAADVLILSTSGDQSLASVPSKLITYMLAARPIIALAVPNSDIARIIKQSGAGWVIDPDRADLLAAQLKKISKMHKTALRGQGEAGRNYALQHFTREACVPKVVNILEQAVV